MPSKEWYQKHKEEDGAKCREYRLTHTDKVNTKRREWWGKNSESLNKKQRTWYAANKDKQRAWELKRRYGLTHEQVESMFLEQGGKCKLCGLPMLRPTRSQKTANHTDGWHIDHNHATGEVRGLIHGKCNRGIGCFDEDPQKLILAAIYLDPDSAQRLADYDALLAGVAATRFVLEKLSTRYENQVTENIALKAENERLGRENSQCHDTNNELLGERYALKKDVGELKALCKIAAATIVIKKADIKALGAGVEEFKQCLDDSSDKCEAALADFLKEKARAEKSEAKSEECERGFKLLENRLDIADNLRAKAEAALGAANYRYDELQKLRTEDLAELAYRDAKEK